MDSRGILNSTPFFNIVLDPGQLDSLAAAAEPVRFRRGETIMRQGEIGDSMLVIVEGKVGVFVSEPGGEQEVATLGPGDIVGEMSLITGERRRATVRTRGRLSALRITKAALEPILAAAPKLAERFAAVVEQRHAELRGRHRDAERWLSVGVGRGEIAALISEYYGH